ncbi:hypothetical protein [Insulibacter thermoxylanivorax]|nr:hypothetical protein [Insulibacter thermoxylanivorax]
MFRFHMAGQHRTDMMLRQLPLLLIGISVYAGAMFAAYHLAAKRFERVDL